jgi:hypothetical protein
MTGRTLPSTGHQRPPGTWAHLPFPLVPHPDGPHSDGYHSDHSHLGAGRAFRLVERPSLTALM